MGKPIPDAHHTLTPAVFVDGALEAIDFYQRALGAEVLRKVVVGGIVINAVLRVGDSVFHVNDPLPDHGIGAPNFTNGDSAAILLWTEDVDGIWARAVEAGAEIINEPETRIHGNRSGAVRDPFGHRWAFAMQTEDLSDEDLLRRVEQWTASGSE